MKQTNMKLNPNVTTFKTSLETSVDLQTELSGVTRSRLLEEKLKFNFNSHFLFSRITTRRFRHQPPHTEEEEEQEEEQEEEEEEEEEEEQEEVEEEEEEKEEEQEEEENFNVNPLMKIKREKQHFNIPSLLQKHPRESDLQDCVHTHTHTHTHTEAEAFTLRQIGLKLKGHVTHFVCDRLFTGHVISVCDDVTVMSSGGLTSELTLQHLHHVSLFFVVCHHMEVGVASSEADTWWRVRC